MIPRSRLLLVTAFLASAALCVWMAGEAGYFGYFSGGPTPHLWRARYADVFEVNDRLVQELANAQSLLSRAGGEIEDLKADVGNLEALLDDSYSERAACAELLNQFDATLETLAARYASSNKSIADLSLRLNQSDAQLAEVTQQRDILRDMLFSAQVKMDGLEETIIRLQKEAINLTNLNAQLRALYSDASDRLEVYESAVKLQGEIYRSFRWYYLGAERQWSKGLDGKKGTGLNRTEYLLLATSAHYQDTDPAAFQSVLDAATPVLKELADYLYGQASTDLQRAENILKFVQYLPYIYDSPADNYVRYPLETLIEGGGDCEDTSVLAAQLFRLAGPEGFPVVLLMVDTNGDSEVDHMMVGVSVPGAQGEYWEVDGIRYYYCETTATAYRVGSKPAGYVVKDAIVIT